MAGQEEGHHTGPDLARGRMQAILRALVRHSQATGPRQAVVQRREGPRKAARRRDQTLRQHLP